MTATFKLTGRVLDKSKRPVRLAKLPLISNVNLIADALANEVYTTVPNVMTDNDGYLCRVVNNGPDDDPGVDLVVGPQYTLRGTSASTLETLVFSGSQAVGGVLDISDIVLEPPDTPPTFADVYAAESAARAAGDAAQATALAAEATTARAAETANATALGGKVNSSTYVAGLASKADLVSGTVPLAQIPDLSASYAAILKSVTSVANSSAPAVLTTTKYDATAAGRTPTLPALAGLGEGTTLAVQKGDAGTNTVVVSCAGSDTFDSGTTALTLRVPELRVLQVVVIGGTKFWKVVGGNTPLSSLDTVYQPLAVDIRKFGSGIGVGNADADTAALVAAVAYITNPANTKFDSTLKGFDSAPSLTIPGGMELHYNANSGMDFPAGSKGILDIRGVNGKPRIVIDNANTYLFDITKLLTRLHLQDIVFVGGAGYFRDSSTEEDVRHTMKVVDCEMYQWSAAAFSNQSQNAPQWQFDNCWWRGLDQAGVICAALGGLTNLHLFRWNHFLTYHVGVKLTDGGQDARFENCQWVQYTPYSTFERYPIWVVPKPDSNNAGTGLKIKDCKFGNEYWGGGAKSARILYADEPYTTLSGWTNLSGDTYSVADPSGISVLDDVAGIGHLLRSDAAGTSPTAGMYAIAGGQVYLNIGVGINPNVRSIRYLTGKRGDRLPDTTNPSAGFIDGHVVSDNDFYGTSTGPTPVIRSMTPNIRNCNFQFGTLWSTGFTHGVYFDTATLPVDYTLSYNVIGPIRANRLGSQTYATSFTPSNIPRAFHIVDLLGISSASRLGVSSFPPNQRGDGYLSLGGGTAASSTASNSASATSLATITGSSQCDAFALSDGVEVKLPTSAAARNYAFNSAALRPGAAIYVELSLQRAATDPMPEVQVQVKTVNGNIHARAQCELPTTVDPLTNRPVWRGVKLGPFRIDDVSGTIQLQIGAIDSTVLPGGDGSGRFNLGGPVRIYHANTPISLTPRQEELAFAAGKGVKLKQGQANSVGGTATLTSGGVTINTTAVTANSNIFLGIKTLGTVTSPQALYPDVITPGTSFHIKSASPSDTSTVFWEIHEPA